MAGSSGRPAMASVEGGDEGAGEHEHDRRVVDEHDERDEDAERAVDLVVRPDLLDVEPRSEEHTSELQSLAYLVCRLLLEKKKKQHRQAGSTSKTKTTRTEPAR